VSGLVGYYVGRPGQMGYPKEETCVGTGDSGLLRLKC
jgi:hypothetical protein